MIYFLIGENWYARDKAVKAIVERADGLPEYIDAEKVTAGSLRELLSAQTLFSQTRTVVLRQPSENKDLWDSLEDIASGVADDVTLIIIEDKPDKRTKTYKALQKQATTKDFPNWTERDTGFATEWLLKEAKARAVPLKTRDAQLIIQRVGVDQGGLAAALEKISLMPAITPEAIEASIDTTPTENVFVLLETALSGKRETLATMIATLRQTEDAYRVFGLLSSQLQQLALLVYAKKPAAEVARDIGAKSPYMLQKLEGTAKRLGKEHVATLLTVFANADMRLKSTDNDPWSVVESALYSSLKD
ncbi:DNA polymerase III subunit delta [Candidatus Saccharibacteria bacterium RAAC3_TM7_1]|nr:DNA polymerase III subunit delta [Candidatus Saccharibacteria bacterium RAAC3_TM7_1]HCZ28706.1 DNA polymerase III subunit delta [Candidatus Saccharibacteria bacterium]